MNLAAKAKTTLTAAVLAGGYGVTQFHYVVSHWGTIAGIGATGGVLAAVWMGTSVKDAIKLRRQEAAALTAGQQAPAPSARQQADDIIAAMRDALPLAQPQQWSPRADKQVIDMTAPANAQRITRL